MIRRPPRSTLDRSSAASDVYKRQDQVNLGGTDHASDKELAMAKMLVDSLSGDYDPAEFDDDYAAAVAALVAAKVSGGGPVSYTHLRAHETVLDLVCRLLLAQQTRHISRRHIDCVPHSTQ